MTLLLTHDDDSNLVVLHAKSMQRSYLTAAELQTLVFDLGSWCRFLVMLRTGEPAQMTSFLGGGSNPQHMKVCRQGSLSDTATYDSI